MNLLEQLSIQEQCSTQLYVKILYAKLNYQHSIQFKIKRAYRITERNSITRSTQIYPGKTLRGKTQQEKIPQYR